jgi:cytochrome P450
MVVSNPGETMATEQLVHDLAAEAKLDDPAFYQSSDRFSTYAKLRREAPVFWYEPGEFWALSKHEDISWMLLQNNPPFTATQGLFMLEAKRPDRIDARDLGGAQQAGLGFFSDPPQHTRFRRLISGAFTEQRLADLKQKAQALADELLDDLPENEPVNFVEALAVPYTIGVIGLFLGVSRDTWDDMRRWTDTIQASMSGGIVEGSAEWQQSADYQVQMGSFFLEQVAERVRNPREDFLSTLAAIEDEGKPLPEGSLIAVASSVMLAGNDTTRHALSGGMAAFAQHPEQWSKLSNDPSLTPRAIEELLRWVTPVIHFGRRATESLVIREQEIAGGDFVVVLFESGNRDEDAWADADTFDITRPTRPPHLAFGWGIHRCVGAALTLMEMRILLDGLIKRFESWELAGPAVRARATLVNNYLDVPIVLKRR